MTRTVSWRKLSACSGLGVASRSPIVVVRGEVPPQIRRNVELWIGCVAGAPGEEEYRRKLANVGFEEIDLEPTRIYHVEDAREFLTGRGIDVDTIALQMEGKFMSAFVRACKPVTA